MALRELGFSPLAERVYRALLERPDSPPATLAEYFDLPQDKISEALGDLVGLKVVRLDPATPATVSLAHPSSALGDLIERREDELLVAQRRVGDIRTEVAELTTTYLSASQFGNTPGLERIEDLDKVRERLEELAFFTRTSVWSVQPGGAVSRPALDAARPLDLRGLRRGIDMRTIYNTAFLDDDGCRDYARDMVAAGAKVRFTEEPLERMIIMDDSVAMLPIDPENSRRGVLIVRQHGLLSGFRRLFHRLWDMAIELPSAEGTAGDEGDLVDEDRKVLELLAKGSTDETAARVVGVSVRHLRRRVARLMERLGAGSRFEAGVEAARRGWI